MLNHVAAELSTISQTDSLPTWSQLEKFPYLTGIILESIRLNFGISTRNNRVLPVEDLHYKNITIPQGTPIGITSLAVHTDESLYPSPWEFRPERWIGEKGKELRKYMVGFSKGSRICLGMQLAYLELYLTTARMFSLLAELELFETGEEDVRFTHDFFLPFPKLGSKGVQVVWANSDKEARL